MLVMFWACSGHLSGIVRACVGHAADMFRVRFEHTLGMCRILFGHVLRMFRACGRGLFIICLRNYNLARLYSNIYSSIVVF